MEPIVRSAATGYATTFYPAAELVVVGGSAVIERRPRSDIDLLVVGPASMFDDGLDEAAHTDRWQGELFEVFAATPDAFRRHLAAGIARLRPVSAFLLIDGVAVIDHGTSEALIATTRSAIDAGPTVSAKELRARRYSVTCTLDDFTDATDRAERAVLAAQLVQRLAEFVLLANGAWIASGRHLLRRLAAVDPVLADALGAALADQDGRRVNDVALKALAPFGGRLLEGYRR